MKRYKTSEHTRLGWYLGILAVSFELMLGMTYIFSKIKPDRIFGYITLLEGVFALTGLLLIDVIYGHSFRLKPDFFKPPETETFWPRTIYILGALFLLQIVMQFPLTVRTWHKALAIVFAGVSEELFFRGLLISPLIRLGENDTKFKIKKFGKRNEYYLEISFIEIFGITLSSFFFMMIHVNYYENTRLLISVFLSGIVLGLFYQKYRDLTANILAHFILNTIVTIQVFGQLFF